MLHVARKDVIDAIYRHPPAIAEMKVNTVFNTLESHLGSLETSVRETVTQTQFGKGRYIASDRDWA
jgi:hypothetical protein